MFILFISYLWRFELFPRQTKRQIFVLVYMTCDVNLCSTSDIISDLISLFFQASPILIVYQEPGNSRRTFLYYYTPTAFHSYNSILSPCTSFSPRRGTTSFPWAKPREPPQHPYPLLLHLHLLLHLPSLHAPSLPPRQPRCPHCLHMCTGFTIDIASSKRTRRRRSRRQWRAYIVS